RELGYCREQHISNGRMEVRRIAILMTVAVFAGCSSNRTQESEQKTEERKATQAPERFYAKFETTKGDFIMEVVRDWAPRGADRFHELVQEKFYEGSRIFRVRPGFVVQFGINKDPEITELWRQLRLPDDPVVQKNRRGYVSY